MQIKKIVFMTLLFLLIFGSQVVFADTETSNQSEDEEIIFPVYEFETYEEFAEFKKSNFGTEFSTYANYSFGRTSFSNHVWIRGGAGHYNLNYIDLEKINRNQIALEVYDMNGKYYGKAVTARTTLWVTADFRGFLPRGQSYKVKMVNLDSGTATVLQGVLNYN